MKGFISLVVALAAVVPAAGQTPETAGPPAPIVKIDPPGVAASAGDRACRSGSISLGPQTFPLTYCIENDLTAGLRLAVRIPAASVEQFDPLIDEPNVVAGILSDRRYSDFWPVITAYGGEDGRGYVTRALQTRKERSAAVERGPAARDTLSSALDAVGRRSVAEADTLSRWGLTDEAVALLRNAIPEPDRKGRLSGQKNFRFVGLELRRGIILQRSERYDEALAVFSALEKNSLIDPVYRINGTVNRAAILAETGQAEAALLVVEEANALFRQAAGYHSIEGSQRQFDWIRSCALHKLGRTEEAARIVAGLFSKDIPSRGLFKIPTNQSIEFRYRRCIADKAWARDFLVKQIDSPLPHVAIEGFFRTEQGDSPMADLAAELRAEPFIQKELAQFRELPDGWRDLADRDRRALIAREILAGPGR